MHKHEALVLIPSQQSINEWTGYLLQSYNLIRKTGRKDKLQVIDKTQILIKRYLLKRIAAAPKTVQIYL